MIHVNGWQHVCLTLYNFRDLKKISSFDVPNSHNALTNTIVPTKNCNIMFDNPPFCLQWPCWYLSTSLLLIGIIVMLHPLLKCGWLLSIPYHKVWRDVKKTNAYNLFLLSNNFFCLLTFWRCNAFAFFMQFRKLSHEGWWHPYFLCLTSKKVIGGFA